MEYRFRCCSQFIRLMSLKGEHSTREYHTIYIHGARKLAFDRFLRENIKMLGTMDSGYLDVEINQKELEKLKDCFKVVLRAQEPNNLMWKYVHSEISLEEMYSALVPYIFVEAVKP